MKYSRRVFIAGLSALTFAGASEKIRVGCQTRVYGSPIRDRERLLRVLEELAAAGFGGFETNFNSLQSAFAEPGPVRAQIERRGIPLIGLHANARLHDPATLEQDRALVLQVAKGTRDLGGTHVMLSGPGIPRTGDGALMREPLDRRCEELNRLGRECRQLDLRLCVHNHAKELEHDAEEWKAALTRTDASNVSAVVDLSYVHLAGMDGPKLIREHAARIAAVHMRDVKDGKEALPGDGEMDYAAIAKAFRDAKWSGWAILEVNQRKDIESGALARRGRENIRRVMKI